jgi:hypothetical protein
MGSRVYKISAEICDESEAAASRSCFSDSRGLLGFTQKKDEARSHAGRSSSRTIADLHWPSNAAKRAEKSSISVVAGRSVARANADLAPRGKTPGIHHRLSVGCLQMRPPPALRFRGLGIANSRKRSEHRLRLGALGHFRGWRKAFEGRREHGVRFDYSIGRVVEWSSGRVAELCGRERSAQAPAPRPLLFCDGDGALECVFSGGRTRRITVE